MPDSKKVTSNLLWRFLERCGAQGVTFIVSLILARLLEPKVFGIIAIVGVFSSILSIFVDGGFVTSIIQKKDVDELDYNTLFYFNLFMCVLMYTIMFFVSPFIAKYYEMPELTKYIRVLSLSLILGGINCAQCTYVTKNLMFKKFFFSTLTGTIGAAILGVTMAYMGFGVWALIAQNLFNTIVDGIILWITVKWRPKLMFSFERLKSHLSFGWKLLVSSLIDKLYNEITQLIIGKKYTPEDLALYNKGNSFPNFIVNNINSSIDSVLLPTMSEVQDDKERVKSMTRRAITVSTYIMMPMMMGLAVCAEPIILFLIKDKWLFCVPYLRIFCFTYAFYPIHTANLNAIKAMGRSDIFLKLEIIKKIIGIIALFSTYWISPLAMAISLIFTSIICQIINSFPNKKLLNYSYFEQLKDMLPQIFLSLLMGAAVYSTNFIPLSSGLKLLIQIPLGILIYVSLSILFKVDSFNYILGIIKKYIKK